MSPAFPRKELCLLYVGPTCDLDFVLEESDIKKQSPSRSHVLEVVSVFVSCVRGTASAECMASSAVSLGQTAFFMFGHRTGILGGCPVVCSGF